MKNLSQISKCIKTVFIPVYSSSKTILEVEILAECNSTRFKVILCRIGNFYQDFWYKKSINMYKPLSEVSDTFGEWWDEEDLSELRTLPIFKDYVDKICTYRFLF